MSPDEAASVVGTVSGCAVAGGVLGGLALRAARRRSMRWAVAIAALFPLLVAVAGVLVVSHEMFLSEHDRDVLAVVLGAAAVVASVTALLLGGAVSAAAGDLASAARDVGTGRYIGLSRSLPAELANVDAALVGVSASLREAREREHELERSRRELVAWVSHDLRTPIAGIRAMSEALVDGVVEDRATTLRYASSIRSEAERLSGLVDDLFELSRIHADALRTTVEQVALWEVLTEALDSAQPVAAAKGVRLQSTVLDADEPVDRIPRVAGNPADLLRVVRNLLTNAIRHTPADGVIAVRAGVTDDSAWFEVADACGGIPEEDLPRLFDVAFRGTAARTPGDDAGGGLGLVIARGLVEAHGGGITVENAGPGCRVLVRIPAQADGATAG